MTRRLADELGLRIHMHTAETAQFADLIEKAHGHRSNVRVYRDGGCLGPDVQLLGCAWLGPDEIDVVAATGTALLLDPTAAMFIGAGMPPLLRLLGRRRPMRARHQRAGRQRRSGHVREHEERGRARQAGRPRMAAPSSQQRALDLATIEGARALGLDGAIGSLEPGKRADVVVVDLESPFVAPALDVVTALVSACKGRDVRDVMIDGRIVVRDRRLQTVDEAAIVTSRRRDGAARRRTRRTHVARTGLRKRQPEVKGLTRSGRPRGGRRPRGAAAPPPRSASCDERAARAEAAAARARRAGSAARPRARSPA